MPISCKLQKRLSLPLITAFLLLRYNSQNQDLEKWYPKVRSGGVIIGDDAVDTDESQRNSENNVFINWGYQNCYGNYGVIKAFRDFVIGKNCKNFIIGNQYIILKD